MAKRKKPSKAAVPSAASNSKLSHNPFGALGAIQGAESDPTDLEERAQEDLVSEEKPLRFPQKLVVRMEKKGRRGKTVTRVSGLPTKDIASLAVEMKKALGCGASVEGAELILQGSLVERAVAWLTKQGARQVVKGT